MLTISLMYKTNIYDIYNVSLPPGTKYLSLVSESKASPLTFKNTNMVAVTYSNPRSSRQYLSARAIGLSGTALIIGFHIIDSPLTFTTFPELISLCLEMIQLQGANGQGLM